MGELLAAVGAALAALVGLADEDQDVPEWGVDDGHHYYTCGSALGRSDAQVMEAGR